jgi:hypothetical protein
MNNFYLLTETVVVEENDTNWRKDPMFLAPGKLEENF